MTNKRGRFLVAGEQRQHHPYGRDEPHLLDGHENGEPNDHDEPQP